MPNLFDLLDDEDSINQQLPTIQKKLSKRAQKKSLKNNENLKNVPIELTLMGQVVYRLEELWLTVLEYLPVKDLYLKIGTLNGKECERVNSNEFIVKLLKRDCNGFFNFVSREAKFSIVYGVDQDRFFKSISDSLRTSHQVSKRNAPHTEQPRHWRDQILNCKSIFKNIHRQLSNINKDLAIQDENRMHHARFFIERELAKVKKTRGGSIQRKQLDCSHFQMERNEIKGDTRYKHLIMCKKCGLGIKTNFLPESIYSKLKVTITTEYDVCGKYTNYEYQEAGYKICPTKHFMEFVGLL